MKTESQSTRAKANFTVKMAPFWLSKLLHFGTENSSHVGRLDWQMVATDS